MANDNLAALAADAYVYGFPLVRTRMLKEMESQRTPHLAPRPVGEVQISLMT